MGGEGFVDGRSERPLHVRERPVRLGGGGGGGRGSAPTHLGRDRLKT